MDKSPQAFRTISEVSEGLDVPSHVLRFWESKFPQVKPVKRGGGRRYYRPEDVALIVGIRELLYEDGLTIKGVQKIFRERGAKAVIDRGAGAPAFVGAPPETAPESAPQSAPETAPETAPKTAPAEAAPNGRAAAEPAPQSAPEPAPEPAPEVAAAPDTAPEPSADAARVRTAIARLEALRARLRTPPPGTR